MIVVLSYILYYLLLYFSFFFFNDTATTEIYTLSLHDALPISCARKRARPGSTHHQDATRGWPPRPRRRGAEAHSRDAPVGDRKSTRLNSSHSQISYAVFCLKKKTHLKTSIIHLCTRST